MTTWDCNCIGDPVGESAKDVLEAILERTTKEEQERALQVAQKALVTRVCERCWQEGLEQILWVHSYIELEEKLEKALQRAVEGGVTENWYLHRAAGIAENDDVPSNFYAHTLIPRLREIPPEQWLSNVFAKSVQNPIVQIWYHYCPEISGMMQLN